eukprot:m.167767 g.167767  ORF g.167767 m.167767 type:complete len:188 (+) comp12874_c0_seq1:74-637(+)
MLQAVRLSGRRTGVKEWNHLLQGRRMSDEAVRRRMAKAGKSQLVAPKPTPAQAPAESAMADTVFRHHPTPWERVVLVLGLAYAPFKVPQTVSFGEMATAASRVRILANVVTFFTCMYITEVAIDAGRAARDDPEVPSLYLPKHPEAETVSEAPYPFGPGPGSKLIPAETAALPNTETTSLHDLSKSH